MRLFLGCIVQVDENRCAADCKSGFNISSSVTDHETVFEVDPTFVRGLEQHARLGFSARAVLCLDVTAHFDSIDRKLLQETFVHLLHCEA